jgi:hypothetical protein
MVVRETVLGVGMISVSFLFPGFSYRIFRWLGFIAGIRTVVDGWVDAALQQIGETGSPRPGSKANSLMMRMLRRGGRLALIDLIFTGQCVEILRWLGTILMFGTFQIHLITVWEQRPNLNPGNIDVCNQHPFPQAAGRSASTNGAAVDLQFSMSITRTTKRSMCWKENCISDTTTERRWLAQERPSLFRRANRTLTSQDLEHVI